MGGAQQGGFLVSAGFPQVSAVSDRGLGLASPGGFSWDGDLSSPAASRPPQAGLGLGLGGIPAGGHPRPRDVWASGLQTAISTSFFCLKQVRATAHATGVRSGRGCLVGGGHSHTMKGGVRGCGRTVAMLSPYSALSGLPVPEEHPCVAEPTVSPRRAPRGDRGNGVDCKCFLRVFDAVPHDFTDGASDRHRASLSPQGRALSRGSRWHRTPWQSEAPWDPALKGGFSGVTL